MKKRIFVGIEASPNLKLKIQKWRENYNKLPVRWIKPNNLHLTLIPPWWESDVNQVIQKLDSYGYKTPPFEIRLTKISYGPKKNKPRLIWIPGESKEIIHLKKELETALFKISERRLFKVHLTIARFRPKTFKSFPVKRIDEIVNWRQTVNYFCLYESKLAREGAQYKIIKRTRF